MSLHQQPVQTGKEYLSEGWVYLKNKDLYSFLDEFFVEGGVVRTYMKENNRPNNRIHLVDSLNNIYRELVTN